MTDRLAPDAPLVERVRELAVIQADNGYLADAVLEIDGTIRLREHNCAIFSIAKASPAACQAELELFSEVLGADVVRESHIASGDRCCTYRITENYGGRHLAPRVRSPGPPALTLAMRSLPLPAAFAGPIWRPILDRGVRVTCRAHDHRPVRRSLWTRTCRCRRSPGRSRSRLRLPWARRGHDGTDQGRGVAAVAHDRSASKSRPDATDDPAPG